MPADRIQRGAPSASRFGGAQGEPRTTRRSTARAPLQNLYTTVPLVRLNASPSFYANLPMPSDFQVAQSVPMTRALRPAPTALQSFLDRQAPERRSFGCGSDSLHQTNSCLGLTLGPSTDEPTEPLVSLPQQPRSAAVASGSQLSLFAQGPKPKPYVRGQVEALDSASPQTPSPVLRETYPLAIGTPDGWQRQRRLGDSSRWLFTAPPVSPTQRRRQEPNLFDVRRTATISPREPRSSSLRPLAPASPVVTPQVRDRQQWLENQRQLFGSFGFSREQCLQITWSANATVRRVLPQLLPQLLPHQFDERIAAIRFDYFTTADIVRLATVPGAGQFLPNLAYMTGMLMELNYHPEAMMSFVSRPHAQLRLQLLDAHRSNLYDASANLRQEILEFYFVLPKD